MESKLQNKNASQNDNATDKPSAASKKEEDYSSPQWAQSLSNLSTPLLDSKLTILKNLSSTLASSLTAKLASSPSGQSLLHIGPSLSTLPPDLQSLLASLEPMLKQVEDFEKLNQNELIRIVTAGKLVEAECRRALNAKECNALLKDLVAAEEIIQQGYDTLLPSSSQLSDNDMDQSSTNSDDELNYMVSLERVAHTTLHLVNELQKSSEQVTSTLASNGLSMKSTMKNDLSASTRLLPSMDTPLPQDTEKAQFMMKLAPRIRSLEKGVIQAITKELERILSQRVRKNEESSTATTSTIKGGNNVNASEQELLVLGCLFRSFALLGRGSDAELIFARVSIMPIVRKKITLGKLDEGGSRGECAGLFSLLEDLMYTIKNLWGDVLSLVEGLFQADLDVLGIDSYDDGNSVEIDLVTAGVWVPIATSLMTDPTIKMAIFSPGITSILQANYIALDTFLAEFAANLLTPSTSSNSEAKEESKFNESFNIVTQEEDDLKKLYHKPEMNLDMINLVQSRLYKHSMTSDFMKKWNLPIYYQLRFGEACKRLEKAIENVQAEGWQSDVFTGTDETAKSLRDTFGFEIPFFLEAYDTMSWLWNDDVFLKPLTHRFLRGAIQLLGRVVLFVEDGLNGKIKFAVQPVVEKDENDQGELKQASSSDSMKKPMAVDISYFWHERIDDVAAVSWDLTILETCVNDAYATTIASKIIPTEEIADGIQVDEVKQLVEGALTESSEGISPIIYNIWNDIIVNILTAKCSTPLAAVKGVAATYRMTNRPPPSQPSPFVPTILSPLKEFNMNFMNRTPPQVGFEWKSKVVSSVAEKYCIAVSELTETVQRTEEALKNRKARRTAAGKMSDGEKVKLQLLLDQKEFYRFVEEVGVDAESIEPVTKLVKLTESAQSLLAKS